MIRWPALTLIALFLLMLAPTASAKPIAITFPERAGDEPVPGLDVLAAGIAYDRDTGALAGSVTLGAPPVGTTIVGISIHLGYYSRTRGHCIYTHAVTIWVPEPDEVAEGITQPYTELDLFKGGDLPLGTFPTVTQGATITFGPPSDPAVLDILRRAKFTCASLLTNDPTFESGDYNSEVPLIDEPRPRCRILKRSAPRGGSFPVRCKNAGRRVGVKINVGDVVYSGNEVVRRGRFRVPMAPRWRGPISITIWKGDVQVAAFEKLKLK